MLTSKLVKNFFAQVAGKATSVVVSLVLTGLLTRFLGVSGYGKYTFISALILLFGTVSDWGTNIISVREASSNKDLQAKIFGTSVVFRFLLSITAFILFNLALRLNPLWKDFVVPGEVGSFVLLALSLKTSSGIVFQTLADFKFLTLIEGVSSVSFLALVFGAYILDIGLVGVMFSWFVATLLSGVLGLTLALRIVEIKWTIDLKIAKKIFWEALPAGALFLVFNIYNRVDTVILQYFWGNDVVGVYGLSYKIYDNLVLGAAFLMNAVFPYLSESFKKPAIKNEVKNYYQGLFDLLFVFGIGMAVITFFLSPLVIRVLAGERYDEFYNSILILRLLIFASFFAYLNHLTGYSLIALGKQKISLAIALAVLVFNVTANWFFVPVYSYKASALITVATEALVLLLSTLAVRRYAGFFPNIFSFQTYLLNIFKRRRIRNK